MPVVATTDVVLYCRGQGWSVVGYNLELLVREGETVRVAVLALDGRGHFLAVSPITWAYEPGIGIIDLTTAEASFARLTSAPTQAGSDGQPLQRRN
jgi:hypothetical protein